jgi:hypothetical protein
MSRALVIINSAADRQRATAWVEAAPVGTRVEFKQSKRSLPQNARFWAMASDVASQLTWHGRKLRAEDWKLIFLAALKREQQLVPNLDGTGFVNIGTSSSDLSKGEMSDMMEIIAEFGTRHGVVFHDRAVAA